MQIGSNDGEQLDPLRGLIRERGWSGIMVEPVPFVFERLRLNYGDVPGVALENVAIDVADGSRPLYHLPPSDDPDLPPWYDSLGSFDRDVVLKHREFIPDIDERIVSLEVPCLSFDSLCRRHGVERIDLVHIDTEGHDFEILELIDLDRRRPGIVLFEHLHLDPATHRACIDHVGRHGYETMSNAMDTLCLRVAAPFVARPPRPSVVALDPQRPAPRHPVNEDGGPIHVAVATDDAYAPWCATLLRSCLDHRSATPLHFHLLHDGGLRPATRDRLQAVVAGNGDLHVHEVDPARIEGLPSIDRFGRIVWLRLLLPELLAAQARVLYLDADTFVTRPLDELWATPLDGSPLAAVANVVHPGLHEHVASLGIDDHRNFFNSGVLVLDLEVQRREGSAAALTSFAAEHDELLWPDQDALNAVFAGRWRRLHPRWNAQNSFWAWRPWAEEVFGAAAIEEATTDPAVIHFEGPSLNKPWHHLSEHPWRDAYRRTLATTPFADTDVRDRTPATRAIALLHGERRVRAFLALERWRGRRHGTGTVNRT